MNTPLHIGVTSQNAIKIESVQKAYGSLNIRVRVVGYNTSSGVAEQPIGEEALRGAQNRARNLLGKELGLDRIVSIENGIFLESNHWIDRAIVLVRTRRGEETIVYSDGVEFPVQYVEIAKRIGFDKITVGQVMADDGFVEDAKDPHHSLSGRSRQAYLVDAVRKAIKEIER